MTLSWDSLCRLCVASEGSNNILFNVEGESKAILQLIEKYLAINISPNDDMPPGVCRGCSDKLTAFHDFASHCEKTQTFFLVHKNTTLQDDIHLQFLKSEFELGEDSVKIKCEQNYDGGDIPFEDDDLDYLPLSNLRSIKKKDSEEKSIFTKKKKGRPRKRLHPVDSDDDKVFSELEKLMDGEILDRPVGEFETVDIRRHRKIKDECVQDDGNYFDLDDYHTKPFKHKSKKKSKSSMSSLIKKPISEKKVKFSKKRNYEMFKFECHFCEKELSNWNALKLHVKKIHQGKPRVMCVCFKYLTTRRSLQLHMAQHDPSKSFKCESCNKVFGSQATLANHALYHLPKEEYPFVCCKCAKRFTTARILKSHEMTHVPREERFVIPCDLCGNKFATKGALSTHKRVIHEKLKPFVCDTCGHAFGTKANLDEHRTRHGDEKNFVCNECKKSFKTKGSMVRHMDTHGDTAYQCPQCPMILNSRRTLRNHLFVHDARAKHVCPFCEKAFKRRKDVKCHIKLHTGERPYTCPWCPRTFTNGSNCRIHKRRMHPHEFQIAEAFNPFAPPQEAKVGPKKVIHATFRSSSITNLIDPEPFGISESLPSGSTLKKEDIVDTNNSTITEEMKSTSYPIKCK